MKPKDTPRRCAACDEPYVGRMDVKSAELAELEASAAAAARLMKLLASEQRLILLCRLS